MGMQALGGRKAEAGRNDALVLAAATEVFLEQGYDAPMSAIAEKAGVGMGSLYRRYRSKDELIRRLCTESMQRTLEMAERALAEEPDGWSALSRFLHESVRGGAGSFAGMAGSFPVTGDMVELAERAAAAMRAVIDRSEAEGTLRPGITPADLTYLCRMLRFKIGTDPEGFAADLRMRYLAVLLHGLRRTDDEALPGAGPDWSQIAGHWSGRTPPENSSDTNA